jgi:hypothetical protein
MFIPKHKPIYQTNIETYDFYNSYYNLKIG